jgi:hypothetical protein
MKITVGQLRRIIREELVSSHRASINEAGFFSRAADAVKGAFGGGKPDSIAVNINYYISSRSVAGRVKGYGDDAAKNLKGAYETMIGLDGSMADKMQSKLDGKALVVTQQKTVKFGDNVSDSIESLKKEAEDVVNSFERNILRASDARDVEVSYKMEPEGFYKKGKKVPPPKDFDVNQFR